LIAGPAPPPIYKNQRTYDRLHQLRGGVDRTEILMQTPEKAV